MRNDCANRIFGAPRRCPERATTPTAHNRASYVIYIPSSAMVGSDSACTFRPRVSAVAFGMRRSGGFGLREAARATRRAAHGRWGPDAR
ncbi:hypothetical protein GCM10010246_40170 [Streptomyces cuspidosporus]|uniref:Uncharacterized protein n=1 Tax=Streptomyces cuspidosporus TaxID=66882 RepID=A0ABP5TAM5_9ACTN